MEITIDEYYQDMIDNILNGASDREQLEIIYKLVVGLKEWNNKGNDYLTDLYYYKLDEIEKIIKETLGKDDYYSACNKAIKDYTELQKILSLYIINNGIYRNKFGALRELIKNDERFSFTNDLEENDMLDFWYKDILLTLHKVGNVGYELIGIEVYDYNGNHLRTFDNIESLKKEVEVLDNEREINY